MSDLKEKEDGKTILKKLGYVLLILGSVIAASVLFRLYVLGH
jgi:hypothetical protein